MTRLSLYLVTLLLGSRFPGPAVQPAAPPAHVVVAQQQQLSYEEQRLVNLVNFERRSRGLQELRVNPMLVRVAREHSREMYEKSYFDHVSPTADVRTPKDRYLKGLGRVPTWACIGENLFYSSIVDPDLGHRCLMQSPAHKHNILATQFNEIGVGVYESPDGRFWVTQMFITQID